MFINARHPSFFYRINGFHRCPGWSLTLRHLCFVLCLSPGKMACNFVISSIHLSINYFFSLCSSRLSTCCFYVPFVRTIFHPFKFNPFHYSRVCLPFPITLHVSEDPLVSSLICLELTYLHWEYTDTFPVSTFQFTASRYFAWNLWNSNGCEIFLNFLSLLFIFFSSVKFFFKYRTLILPALFLPGECSFGRWFFRRFRFRQSMIEERIIQIADSSRKYFCRR